MKIEKVDIGILIEQRINELGISKSEFGRRIDIPQQNVNRILEKPNIDTDKLISISEALDYNFFTCFLNGNNSGAAMANNGGVAVAGNGTAHHITTNVTMADVAVMQERIKSLEALLDEKERTIKILMEGRG